MNLILTKKYSINDSRKIITNWGWTMYLHKENKELERQIKKEQGYRQRIFTIMLMEKVRECLWMNYISMIVI